MRSLALGIASVLVMAALGCRSNNPAGTTPNDNPALAVTSLTATPAIVPLGGTALIECRVNRTDGRPLNYTWTATGGVDYLQPMDSACIFTAPSCHTGPATVTVVVSDDSVSTTASVDINREQ